MESILCFRRGDKVSCVYVCDGVQVCGPRRLESADYGVHPWRHQPGSRCLEECCRIGDGCARQARHRYQSPLLRRQHCLHVHEICQARYVAMNLLEIEEFSQAKVCTVAQIPGRIDNSINMQGLKLKWRTNQYFK